MHNDIGKKTGTVTRYLLLIAIVTLTSFGGQKPASAQEILLEGPLAGQPAVRKIVQYRKLRASLGPQFGYTLLNEYMHNFMLGAKLEFNITDWLGVGVVGFYTFNAPTSLTKHISESEDISGSPTVPSDSNWPSYTGARSFENQVARLKGMVLGQVSLVPLRGKLAAFEKLFVAIDGYIFVGGGAIIFQQREDCSALDDEGSTCGSLSTLQQGGSRNTRAKKVKGTATFGIGFTAYFNNWIGLNLEYRLAPFKWNAGGTDESGQAGSQWVLASDEADGSKPYWETTARGAGDYPDGRINKEDETWNANQSFIIGVVFNLPTTPKITD